MPTKIELRRERSENGLCCECGERPTPGYRTCEKHRDKRTYRQRRLQERRGSIKTSGELTGKFVCYVSRSVRTKIEELAEIEQMSQSAFVREAIDRYIEDYEQMLVEDDMKELV